MDDDIKFAGLVGMLLGLTDFNDCEFRLKSGPVRRVFEDNKHYEVLLEYYDGTVGYAKETDIDTLDKIIRIYKEENLQSFYYIHILMERKEFPLGKKTLIS